MIADGAKIIRTTPQGLAGLPLCQSALANNKPARAAWKRKEREGAAKIIVIKTGSYLCSLGKRKVRAGSGQTSNLSNTTSLASKGEATFRHPSCRLRDEGSHPVLCSHVITAVSSGGRRAKSQPFCWQMLLNGGILCRSNSLTQLCPLL